jgi:hypothetical protein
LWRRIQNLLSFDTAGKGCSWRGDNKLYAESLVQPINSKKYFGCAKEEFDIILFSVHRHHDNCAEVSISIDMTAAGAAGKVGKSRNDESRERKECRS